MLAFYKQKECHLCHLYNLKLFLKLVAIFLIFRKFASEKPTIFENEASSTL